VDKLGVFDLGEKLVKSKAKKKRKKKPSSFLSLIDKGLERHRDKLQPFQRLT
jgi:hypothetical protein